MDLKTAFGMTLREMRKRKNLSQEKLALECGLDRTFISMLERGKRQPTLTTLFGIAKVLEVSPAQIIAETQKHLCS